jgi:hypothetical protein
MFELLEEKKCRCVNCRRYAFIPAYEEKWTCYACGRINHVKKKTAKRGKR